MTVAFAIKIEDQLFIGSDSRITEGNLIVTDDQEKWFRINQYWFVSYSGAFHALNSLRNLYIRDNRNCLTPEEIVHKIVAAMSKTGKIFDDGSLIGELMMVRVDQSLDDTLEFYHVSGCMTPLLVTNYFAIGSGRQTMLGYLNAIRHFNRDRNLSYNQIVDYLGSGLQTCFKYDNSCGGKIRITRIK